MNTTHNLKRIIAGALLSGGVAVAGLGLASGTAQAFDPQPDPPGKPINGQPEAPGRPITIAVNPQSKWPGVQVTAGAGNPGHGPSLGG